MRSIDALCVTSAKIKRRQILFDEVTGLILDVGDLGIPTSKINYHFDDDKYLFAGMGDVHIHGREDTSGEHCYKEDYHTASRAAINGGVVHMGDMPNNPIPPIDDESYENKLKLTQNALNTCWIYAGVGPKTTALSRKVPYKVYMGPSVGDLYFKNHEELRNALRNYRYEFVSFHCEDPETLQNHKDKPDHFSRRPVEAEYLATVEALTLIKEFNLTGKLCHFSSKAGLAAIREFRKAGGSVQVEVTPQHLFFAQEELKKEDWNFFQMNPPIRECKDRDAMLEALINGEIDYLATDHAPHTHEEKLKGTSGLTGLDTYGGFVTWLIKEKNVSPQLIAKICSENPGDFFNQFLPSFKHYDSRFSDFGKGLGRLEAGYRADFSVLDMKTPWTVEVQDLKTKVKHSPFLNQTFPGRVHKVMKKGQWL